MNMMPNISALNPGFRLTRFGRGAVAIRSKEPLSDDQIRSAAPSVFQEQAHESRSARFSHIPTHALLAPMRKEGFFPYSVTQGGSSIEGKRSFTKHMITFRQSAAMPKVVGGSVLEVGLINAHDGTSSWQLFLRMLKLVCLNGLTVEGPSYGAVKVGHRGDVVNQVIDGTYTVLEQGNMAFDRVEKFERLQLAPPEQSAFAKAAAELRFGNEVPVNTDILNHARRPQDQGDNSLWMTFNRVQENVIRGGLGYQTINEAGKRVNHSTRAVQSIDGDIRLNRALWTLADEMAKLKAA